MKALGCLFVLIFGIIVFILAIGWRLVSSLFGIKGSPFVMFKTMKDVHRNMKNMQEQMKKEQTNQTNEQYHNETSQQRTDTTSPGTRKIIPDDEGEYVSYEEIKDKNS